jgi:hypothetical protein
VEKSVHWKLFDCVEGARNPIEDWYQVELSDAGKFQFDALLKNMATTENHQHWSGFKYLQGEPRKEHVWQVAFKADGKQYRIAGIFDGPRQAVLLVGYFHKQKSYSPPGALDTAIRRAKAVREKRVGKRERQIRFDR